MKQAHTYIRYAVLVLSVGAVILGASSIAIAASDYPDDATVKRLVYALMRVGLEHDPQQYAQLEDSFYFVHKQDRIRFRNGCWVLDPLGQKYLRGQWNYIPQMEDYLVVPKPADVTFDSEPMVAVFGPAPSSAPHPTRYGGLIFTFIKIDGIWRIEYIWQLLTPAESRASATADELEYKLKIRSITEEINKWSNATGAELERLVKRKRDYAILMLSAAEYGSSDMMKKYTKWTADIVNDKRKKMDHLFALSPMQIKDEVIAEAKKKISDVIAEKKAVDAALNAPYRPDQ